LGSLTSERRAEMVSKAEEGLGDGLVQRREWVPSEERGRPWQRVDGAVLGKLLGKEAVKKSSKMIGQGRKKRDKGGLHETQLLMVS